MSFLPALATAMLKSSIVLLIAIAGAHALRRQSASMRHLILAIGLFAGLSLPFFSFVLPPWRPAIASPTVLRLLELPQGQSPSNAVTLGDAGPRESATASAGLESKLTAGLQVRLWLLIWLAGSGIVAARLLVGGLRLAWVSWRSGPVTEERWTHAAREIVQTFSLRRHVRLRSNPRAPMLGAWGVFRPEVLLPSDRESWSDERVRAVLGHELAHIRRHDWLVQTGAEIARAVFWFNPLYWVLCRGLRRESEQACDDAVLRLGIDGTAYATHLLDLARTLNHGDPAWTAILAMARTPNLERRFAAMMNSSVNHRSTTRAGAVLVILIAICLVAPLAVIRAAVQQAPAVVTAVAQAPVAEPKAAPAPVAVPTSPLAVTTEQAVGKFQVSLLRRQLEQLNAQLSPTQTTGNLSGVVSDRSGGLVPGVSVQVWNLSIVARDNPVATARAMSDSGGVFRFPPLEPGDYRIEATLPGFAPFQREGITIRPGASTTALVTLSIATNNIAVSVNAASATPGVSAPASPKGPVRLGGIVMKGRLLQHVDPIYPVTARNAGTEGLVRLQIVIAKDGTTQDVLAESVVATGEGGVALAAAAVEAVKQWRFQPYLLNGAAIDVATTITVTFELTQ